VYYSRKKKKKNKEKMKKEKEKQRKNRKKLSNYNGSKCTEEVSVV
jgi:hypothetical protein